uniref:Homologous recombination OB-fold protein OB-fold domain-containing protein n=1 Tax=Magallana gigas TaxID=29159 RepID=A0A8W8M4J8_MAGGI|nr:uncharacterized protein LOC105346484 isoform X1 [Crassostrea gigas]
MFELPDDDDNFWEDLPLDDITNSKENSHQNATSQCDPRLRGGTTPVSKVDSTELRSSSSEHHSGTEERGHSYTVRDVKSGKRLSSESIQDASKKIRLCEEPDESKVFGHDNNGGRFPVSGVQAHHQNNTSGYHVNPQFVATAKRHSTGRERSPATTPVIKRARRKFPGPAGLLPKLPGNIENPKTAVSFTTRTSPEQLTIEKEDVILSSQSSDDMFNEEPWRTLMEELGTDGQRLLHNFSIASNLNRARKKQLHRGKIPLLMCVIYHIEWHGSDLSVSLKDRSGDVQGTVHRDIMKEFESELQVGSALVLRQVSVISPNPRSHYLNITPANIVLIYSKTGDDCKQINNRNTPLSSVLEEVQREESIQRLQTSQLIAGQTPNRNSSKSQLMQNRTPQSGLRPSTLSHPPIRTPQSSGVRTFTPGNPHVYNRLPHSGGGPSTPNNPQISGGGPSTPNNPQAFNRAPPTSGGLSVPSVRTPSSVESSVNTPRLRTPAPNPVVQTGALGARSSSMQASTRMSFNISNTPVSVRTPAPVSVNSSYSFQQNSSRLCSNTRNVSSQGATVMNKTSDQNILYNTPCEGSGMNRNELKSNQQETPNRRSFKFKPTKTQDIQKLSGSNPVPDSSSALSMPTSFRDSSDSVNSNVSASKTHQCEKPKFEVDWGEDLSDDMLSQLSEEF